MKITIEFLRMLFPMFGMLFGASIHQYFFNQNTVFLPVLIITGIYTIWYIYDVIKQHKLRKNGYKL